jgi:hypothetical protein
MAGAPQVVVLSSIDWDAAWQRHHVFAAAFAAQGREVFFVENTGFRDPSLKDLPRLWRRVRNILSPQSAAGATAIPPGLRVLSPRVLPPTRRAFRALNSRVLLPALRRQLASAGLRSGADCIVYMPTATTLELARSLEPGSVLYDCAANLGSHPSAPPDFAARERELLNLSDQVVCDSDFLYEQKKPQHPHVAKIHQGVPPEFFRAEAARKTWTEFCYYGTWSVGLDSRFPDALASAGLDVTVRGFDKSDAPALSPAVRRAPPVPREQVAASLDAYHAFILPYRTDSFARGVVPAKIYECLATGRPTIATPLPSLQALDGLIYIGETPEDWIRIARGLTRTENEDVRGRRIALAREHSAEKEFARFADCLSAARARRAQSRGARAP